MRFLLALSATFALVIAIAACDNGGDAPGIPRTVPPVSVPSGEAYKPAVQGIGPVYEAASRHVLRA